VAAKTKLQAVEIKALNGKWDLRQEDINVSREDIQKVLLQKKGWMPTPVPGDIHQGLIAAKIIEEPSIGLNAPKAIWTREKSWWLKKTFQLSASEVKLSKHIELCLDGLDYSAWIFINGELVGEHNSAFYPFERDIREYIKPGANNIVVRLTDGLDQVSDDDLKKLGGFFGFDSVRPQRTQPKRVFLRKAQYAWGWDWSPESSTTGITGGAFIRIVYSDYIKDVAVRIEGSVELPVANVMVRTQRADSFTASMVKMSVKIMDPQGKLVAHVSKKQILQSGNSFSYFNIPISNPQLWWPNGTGEQPLYIAKVEITDKGITSCGCQRCFGVRFVEIATDDKMSFVINGKNIFCKGANFVPPDMFYARADGSRYRKLVSEAKDANFSMLRIWGGGLYLPDEFYDACDEYGIMIWHDFMFACAPYPDYLDSFKEEVRREVEYQLTRLRNHPSIVLWCGSNENIWARSESKNKEYGSIIAGTILPEAVSLYCPEIPYFYNSPYGNANNYIHVSNEGSGDCHCWDDTMMSPDMNRRVDLKNYDKINAKFISEYGFPGTCGKKTTVEYLGKNHSLDRNSDSWGHHYNTFAQKTVEYAIAKHYIDPAKLSFDDFLYYSGLMQGRVYAYSLESFRQRQNCYGGLFWMYNDCWGEVGWSIIDCYLRRKISYWLVKRALSPQKIVIRRSSKNKLKVTLINDSLEAISVQVKLAWRSFAENKEKYIITKKLCVESSGRNMFEHTHQPVVAEDGFWFAEICGPDVHIEPACYFDCDFMNLTRKVPKISIKKTQKSKDQWEIALTCDEFAHAVELNLPDGAQATDNYFDIYPGRTKRVIIKTKKKLPDRLIVRYL